MKLDNDIVQKVKCPILLYSENSKKNFNSLNFDRLNNFTVFFKTFCQFSKNFKKTFKIEIFSKEILVKGIKIYDSRK